MLTKLLLWFPLVNSGRVYVLSCRFELICCRYMWSNSERSNTAVYERLLKTSRDRSGRDPVFHPAESACSDYRFSPESRYGAVLTESLFPRAPALSHSEPVLAFTSPDSRTSPWAWKVPLPVWSSWKNDLVILAAPFRRSVSTICTESEQGHYQHRKHMISQLH